MYGVEIPARNNLGIPYLYLKRIMIGMENSRRAPTIPSTGSIFESGKNYGESEEFESNYEMTICATCL